MLGAAIAAIITVDVTARVSQMVSGESFRTMKGESVNVQDGDGVNSGKTEHNQPSEETESSEGTMTFFDTVAAKDEEVAFAGLGFAIENSLALVDAWNELDGAKRWRRRVIPVFCALGILLACAALWGGEQVNSALAAKMLDALGGSLLFASVVGLADTAVIIVTRVEERADEVYSIERGNYDALITMDDARYDALRARLDKISFQLEKMQDNAGESSIRGKDAGAAETEN